MKIFFLIIFLVSIYINGVSQAPWVKQRDSLLKLISSSKEDTNKVLNMVRLGAGYMDNDPDSATYYAKAFGKLSERLHYPTGMAYSLSMQAMIISDQNKPDEALPLDIEAIEIAKKAHLQIVLANVYNNTAITYNTKDDNADALDFYLKASAIYEQCNDSSSIAFISGNISSIYISLKEYQNAYLYSLKAITLCRHLNQTHGFGSSMVNLSSALINLQRFDTALIVLRQAKDFAISMNDKDEEINILINMDDEYRGIGNYDLLKSNAEELMTLATSTNNKEGICYAYLGLVDSYLHEKNYKKAKYYATNAIEIAKKNLTVSTLRDVYEKAARVELEQGNIPGFDHYDKLKDSADKILLSDKILKNTQELEVKYSLNKKQAEINDLNKQQKIQQLTLRQRRTINWILAGVAIMIALVAFMFNRNYEQKKKLLIAGSLLQQQRITELEKEKQLFAAQAILQGQVEERTRLAKDLHDGLGSILSSAKYSFTNMKENIIITPENAAAFERSMGMLDKSINELRRVAHNMMPEALVRFGLDTALKDFCDSIVQSGAVQLTYQSFEINETSIPMSTSSAIYRIIQELVNNILRHANATTALVQLIRKNDALSITVEDNGKGFNANILQNNEGIGYLNLQNRVAYLNGTIDIQTAAGKGTSVNIEISNIAT